LLNRKFLLINLLLLIVFIVILLRLWGGGFSGGDEGFTASAAYNLGGFFNASLAMAESQGRFYQIFYYPLAQIPYLFDSLYWTNFCRILSSASTIASFFLFVLSLFGARVGYISIVVYLALFVTTGSGYNPFHALPFWFNLGMTFMFMSFLIYNEQIKKGNYDTSYSSLLFFIFGLLAYETMIFYVFVFPCIYMFNVFLIKKNKISSQRFGLLVKKSCIKPFTILLIYLGLYFIFLHYFPSAYQGTSGLSFTNFQEVWRTIYIFSTSGIFISGNFFKIIHEFSYQPIIITLLLLICLFQILKIKSDNLILRHNYINSFLLYGALIFFLLCPNILLALTPRYRSWVIHNHFYLGSYFSSFVFAIIIALILDYIFSSYTANKNITERKIIYGFFTFLFIASTYSNHLDSVNFFNFFKSEAIKWDFAKRLSNDFLKINPQYKFICTSSFIKGQDVYNYWSFYFSNKVGREIKLAYYKVDNHECDSRIDFDYEKLIFHGKNHEPFLIEK
jgi:hypothetical protein